MSSMGRISSDSGGWQQAGRGPVCWSSEGWQGDDSGTAGLTDGVRVWWPIVYKTEVESQIRVNLMVTRRSVGEG